MAGTSGARGELAMMDSSWLRQLGLIPHLFRHIFALQWLEEHPRDYLTVSKILWHGDVKTTVRTYCKVSDTFNNH